MGWYGLVDVALSCYNFSWVSVIKIEEYRPKHHIVTHSAPYHAPYPLPPVSFSDGPLLVRATDMLPDSDPTAVRVGTNTEFTGKKYSSEVSQPPWLSVLGPDQPGAAMVGHKKGLLEWPSEKEPKLT